MPSPLSSPVEVRGRKNASAATRVDGETPRRPVSTRLPVTPGRLIAADRGGECRDQRRRLLHNVLLLRQPLPARRLPSATSPILLRRMSAAAVIIGRDLLLLPATPVILGWGPLLLPSASVVQRRWKWRLVLLPPAVQHILPGTAATEPLLALLPVLLL